MLGLSINLISQLKLNKFTKEKQFKVQYNYSLLCDQDDTINNQFIHFKKGDLLHYICVNEKKTIVVSIKQFPPDKTLWNTAQIIQCGPSNNCVFFDLFHQNAMILFWNVWYWFLLWYERTFFTDKYPIYKGMLYTDSVIYCK